jgi:type I restriction enzyme S subunit
MAEQHGKTLVPEIRFSGFTDPWEQRKLGELYQKNDERNTDGLGSERTLSVASMTFNSTGNGADESSLPSYKRLRLGDIAFEGHANKEFAYGRFVLNDAGNGIMSPRFTCLRPIVEQEYSFWKYFIHSEEVMRPILVNSTKSGTMMNELVVKDFLEQEILVPSLPEQRQIGAFFDCLDSLITLHQRKYDKLCVLKKSMLDKMFPKGGSLYPEIRFSGFTDPWEQRKLGELGFAQSGIGFPDAEQGGSEGIPFFKVSDMNTPGNERELVISNNYVTADQIARMSWHPICQVPAIFFAKVGAAVLLNRKRLVNELFLLDNNTMAFSMDPNRLDSQFGQSLFERIDLTSLVQVGALPSYNASDVEDMTVSLPDHMDEQRQIGRYLARLDSLITLHQRKLELLRNIKKSMLDKMFV